MDRSSIDIGQIWKQKCNTTLRCSHTSYVRLQMDVWMGMSSIDVGFSNHVSRKGIETTGKVFHLRNAILMYSLKFLNRAFDNASNMADFNNKVHQGGGSLRHNCWNSTRKNPSNIAFNSLNPLNEMHRVILNDGIHCIIAFRTSIYWIYWRWMIQSVILYDQQMIDTRQWLLIMGFNPLLMLSEWCLLK